MRFSSPSPGWKILLEQVELCISWSAAQPSTEVS
jgi:hypothetical protein